MCFRVIVYMIHAKFNKFNMIVMSMYQHLHTYAPQVVSLLDLYYFLDMIYFSISGALTSYKHQGL